MPSITFPKKFNKIVFEAINGVEKGKTEKHRGKSIAIFILEIQRCIFQVDGASTAKIVS